MDCGALTGWLSGSPRGDAKAVSIVGGARTVVDTGSLKIDEVVGNVACGEDALSLAIVTVSAPACEPWLNLKYDEWIHVTKGKIIFALPDGSEVEANAGDTVKVAAGTRFQPRFPEGGTEYLPVCLPAFRPERCVREEEGESDVAKRLDALHKPKAPPGPPAEILYHMCEKPRWEAAKKSGACYFPPTFDQDGFTHATAVPSRLVDTANHFYQDSTEEWVCLSFKRSVLRAKFGIVVRDEEAMPVGDKGVGETWSAWICPHVVGGIPPGVVHAEYPMTRDGPKYTGITGVTD